MDREEARELLLGCSRYINEETDLWEALDLAIEALSDMSEEEVDYCNNCPYIPYNNNDCISREQVIKTVHKYFVDEINKSPYEIDKDGDEVYTDMKAVNELLKHNKHISKAIKVLPPVNQKQITSKLENAETATSEGEESTMGQPKSKLDCISRQEAIDALCDQCAYYSDEQCKTDSGFWCESGARMRSLPSVTPTVSEDCIPRKWLKENAKAFSGYYQGTVYVVPLSLLEDAPSVTPTVRTGEWKKEENEKLGKCLRVVYVCSACGCAVGCEYFVRRSYCPNCGAKMKGGTENE